MTEEERIERAWRQGFLSGLLTVLGSTVVVIIMVVVGRLIASDPSWIPALLVLGFFVWYVVYTIRLFPSRVEERRKELAARSKDLP